MAYGAPWIANIKWRIYNLSKQLGSGVSGWFIVLQPDSSALTYYKYVRDYGSTREDDPALLSSADQSAKTTASAIGSSLDRVIAQAKAVHDQLRAIAQPATMTLAAQQGWLAGPSVGFPCATKFSAAHIWTLSSLLTRNNGEYLNYIDALDAQHMNTNTLIENYDNTAPSNTAVGPYWQWAALKDGQAVNPAQLMPCVTFKAGIDKTKWSGPYDDQERLREWFLLNSLCCFHWFGFSFWVIYAGLVPAAGITQSLWNNDPASSTIGWDAVVTKFQPAAYDILSFSSAIPPKSYASYADPLTWAVYFQAALVSVATGNPFPGYWTRVAFPGGVVTMAAGGRNIVWRPVYLRTAAVHTISVDIQFAVLGSGLGKVKLRARGHDKLNGLANVEVQVLDSDIAAAAPLWKRISIDITSRQHTVGGLPNPNYVLLVIDHNGVGACAFRNPSITVASPPSSFVFPPVMDSGVASSVDTFDIDSGIAADAPLLMIDGNA